MSAERPRSTQEYQRHATGNVLKWFEERMHFATMQTYAAALDNIAPWEINRERIVSRNRDGSPRFFTIEARKIASSGREVDAFGQPGIIEVIDPSDPAKAVGTVGLLVDKRTGDVLLQAAAEAFQAGPGEPASAYLCLRASLQGSYDNLRLHKVPFSEKVDPSKYTHFTRANPSRIQGRIRVGYTLVKKRDIDLNGSPNMHWFSRREIEGAMAQGAPFNSLFHTAYDTYRFSKHGRFGGIITRRFKQK